LQRADFPVRFFGKGPVVLLASSAAVPSRSAGAPLAVPGVEADDT
jgi:hypothetical protein